MYGTRLGLNLLQQLWPDTIILADSNYVFKHQSNTIKKTESVQHQST